MSDKCQFHAQNSHLSREWESPVHTPKWKRPCTHILHCSLSVAETASFRTPINYNEDSNFSTLSTPFLSPHIILSSYWSHRDGHRVHPKYLPIPGSVLCTTSTLSDMVSTCKQPPDTWLGATQNGIGSNTWAHLF